MSSQASRRAARRRVLPGFPVERPFQSAEEVHRYLSQDRITCLRCGKKYKAIGVHLKTIHGMEPDEYREMYDLPLTFGLTSKHTKRLKSEAMARHIDGARETYLAWLEEARKHIDPDTLGSKPKYAIREAARRMRRLRGNQWEANKPQTWAEFVRRVASGRVPTDVCTDEDMPGQAAYRSRYNEDESFAVAIRDAMRNVPYGVLARHEMLGERFRADVLALADVGLAQKEIAEELGVSPMTVSRHIRAARGTA